MINLQAQDIKEQKWEPVKRTTKEISKVEESVMKFGKDTWKLDFYRNKAYKCGLSGNYTFLVVEPLNNPGGKAPLWVFLHGGALGFYDKDGKYHATNWQNRDTWNHESSLKILRDINPNVGLTKKNGKPIDHTINRRLKEGYRLLVVSYSDHDLYSGCGTPYPNNPKGGEVNGLQATMAALEYTVKNYPTTQIFAHGTSAGSFGAYALGFAFAQEGIDLNGVVMDSGIASPRMMPVFEAFAGKKGFPFPKTFTHRGAIEKIGRMVNPYLPFIPENAVKAGFKSVPMLVIGGEKDRFYGGTFPPIKEAKAESLSNWVWICGGLKKAIKEQKDSPHELVILKNDGHCPTNDHRNKANDIVDSFIKKHSSSTEYPFKKEK